MYFKKITPVQSSPHNAYFEHAHNVNVCSKNTYSMGNIEQFVKFKKILADMLATLINKITLL